MAEITELSTPDAFRAAKAGTEVSNRQETLEILSTIMPADSPAFVMSRTSWFVTFGGCAAGRTAAPCAALVIVGVSLCAHTRPRMRKSASIASDAWRMRRPDVCMRASEGMRRQRLHRERAKSIVGTTEPH